MNNPHPMPIDPHDDLDPLAAAAAGLLYPSESDAPFDLFHWPPTAGASARDAVATHAPSTPITETTLDDFFAELQESDDGPRYTHLRQILTTLLTDVKVFRTGHRKVDVFLIGRTTSRAWAGLHTTSIET